MQISKKVDLTSKELTYLKSRGFNSLVVNVTTFLMDDLYVHL